MSVNPIQSDLLALFEQTRAVIREFADSRGEANRAQIGTEKAWAAKDLLSHVACWMDYMVGRMAYFTHNQTPPRDVDFDAVSREAFLKYQHKSWDDALAYVDRSLEALIATVSSFTDAQLSANNAYGAGEGGPLWGEIRANGFIVPLQELEKFYQRSGDSTRVADMHARLVAVIGEETPIVTDLISAESLAELRLSGHSPLVIDVRDPKEYAAGHVAGAINILLADLEHSFDQLAPDAPIVTYCNMHHKGFSRGEQAAALLADKGYRAAALDGGFPGWKERGLPLESG